MNLSSKGRYAVTAMMDLAMNDRQGPLTLAGLSDRLGVSVSYLEQLFAKLRKARLVEGVRGPGGGYRLARAPAKITVAEIIECVEDASGHAGAVGKRRGKTAGASATDAHWMEFSQCLYQFLNSMNLERFVKRPKIRELVQLQNEDARRLNLILPRPAMG